LLLEPIDGLNQTLGKESNVEPKLAGVAVDVVLFPGEEIHQKRRQPRLVQYLGDIAVTR
jgi:hypothetical protein